MNLTNLKDHMFLKQASTVQEICRPLFQYFGFTNFVYQKNFLNGSEIKLSNNAAWVSHYYQQKHYALSAFERHPDEIKPGFVLWSQLQNHHTVLSDAREFNIDHGITLTKKYQDGIEYYFFGTTRDNHKIVNFYLNNLDLLERFIFYFKDYGSELLKAANLNKIVIPKKYKHAQQITDEGNACLIQKDNRQQFIESIPIKRLQVNDQYNTIITMREFDCARELCAGKTIKEVGKKLNISLRTAETHINNLKFKLNIKTKSDLINKLRELELNNIY